MAQLELEAVTFFANLSCHNELIGLLRNGTGQPSPAPNALRTLARSDNSIVADRARAALLNIGENEEMADWTQQVGECVSGCEKGLHMLFGHAGHELDDEAKKAYREALESLGRGTPVDLEGLVRWDSWGSKLDRWTAESRTADFRNPTPEDSAASAK